MHRNEIHAYVDGQLLMHATDDTFASGRVGLACMAMNRMTFDDLVVYANRDGLANR